MLNFELPLSIDRYRVQFTSSSLCPSACNCKLVAGIRRIVSAFKWTSSRSTVGATVLDNDVTSALPLLGCVLTSVLSSLGQLIKICQRKRLFFVNILLLKSQNLSKVWLYNVKIYQNLGFEVNILIIKVKIDQKFGF